MMAHYFGRDGPQQ